MAVPVSRLFFAYGSSLSLSEMLARCPTSTFYGVAILRNHRWFVSERGYANIAPSHPAPNKAEDVVWGMLYTLRPFDEELLDKHEGLPWAYRKEDMDVEIVTISEDGRGTRREVQRALVYIDRDRVQDSYPNPDLVAKMTRGIQDAVERGMPKSYADRVLRSHLVAAVPTTNGADPSVSTYPTAERSPSTRVDTDLGTRPQVSVAAGQSLNSASYKAISSPIEPPHGLEDSKYAQEPAAGAHWQGGANGQDAFVSHKPSNGRNQPTGNKVFTCWWWKTQGSCKYSEQDCLYAHYDTGTMANAPGKKQRLPPSSRPKRASRQDTNASSEYFPGHGSRDEPAGASGSYGYNGESSAPSQANESNHGFSAARSKGWSASQANESNHGSSAAPSKSWNASQANESDHKFSTAPSHGWDAQPDEPTDPKGGWDGAVENLMDSQPEWLVSNDRRDVNW